MKTIALFNNKGGVGKTTLAYHLACMLSNLGTKVIVVDFDPQANLTGAFCDEDELETLFEQGSGTIFDAVRPIIRGVGDIGPVALLERRENLWLLPGHLGLATFEDTLSARWPNSLTGDEAAVRATTAFHRLLELADHGVAADVVLMDVGPNLGAINRSALLSADHVVVPVAADLFSVQGLRNLGPTLQKWRSDWQGTALPRVPVDLHAPHGTMQPAGYVILQHATWGGRVTHAYERWLRRIPAEFRSSVLSMAGDPEDPDPFMLASLRHYRSLAPLAQDARKPMFELRAADGAVGSVQRLVQTCFQEFSALAKKIQTLTA